MNFSRQSQKQFMKNWKEFFFAEKNKFYRFQCLFKLKTSTRKKRFTDILLLSTFTTSFHWIMKQRKKNWWFSMKVHLVLAYSSTPQWAIFISNKNAESWKQKTVEIFFKWNNKCFGLSTVLQHNSLYWSNTKSIIIFNFFLYFFKLYNIDVTDTWFCSFATTKKEKK